MTQDTEDVVARLAAWSNDPDDEPPIVLMMAAKSAIQSLSDRIDVLEGEKRAVEAQRRELQMLLVRHGDHEAIKKAGDFWPEAHTVFDGRCLKCGGTHLGMPGGCDGPSRPSQPHPHARDMIA